MIKTTCDRFEVINDTSKIPTTPIHLQKTNPERPLPIVTSVNLRQTMPEQKVPETNIE